MIGLVISPVTDQSCVRLRPAVITFRFMCARVSLSSRLGGTKHVMSTNVKIVNCYDSLCYRWCHGCHTAQVIATLIWFTWEHHSFSQSCQMPMQSAPNDIEHVPSMNADSYCGIRSMTRYLTPTSPLFPIGSDSHFRFIHSKLTHAIGSIHSNTRSSLTQINTNSSTQAIL